MRGVRMAWWFVAVLIGISGCGGWQINLQRGIATAAITSSSCAHALDAANDDKQSAIRTLAATDPQGAQTVKDAWTATRGKIMFGCESANLLAMEAKRLAPTLTSKNAGEWIGKLLAVVLDVKKILDEHGLKLPGGL